MTEKKIGRAFITPSETEKILLLRKLRKRTKIRKVRNGILAVGASFAGYWIPFTMASGYETEAKTASSNISNITKKITPLTPAFGWATYHDGVKDAESAEKALKWECVGHTFPIPDEWKKYPNGKEAREKLTQLEAKITKAQVFDPQGPQLTQKIEAVRNNIPDTEKIDPKGNECWDVDGRFFPKIEANKEEAIKIGELKKIITDRINTISPTIPQDILEQVAKGEINAALADIKATEDKLINQKNELVTKRTEATNKANSLRGFSYGVLAIGACVGVARLSGTLINRVNEDRKINRIA